MTRLDAHAAVLETFSDSFAKPEERRAALTILITAKVLPKEADNSAVIMGRDLWIRLARDLNVVPKHRLLAIAECIRLGQTVKRWMPNILKQLEPAFVNELPPLQLLEDADDRLNLARACSAMSADWLPDYLARAICTEETGEKTRTEMVSALLRRVPSLDSAIGKLAVELLVLRPGTESPGDTLARRLTRTLSALRESLMECELDAGDELGLTLHNLLSKPLAAVGKPEEDKVRIELANEALLTVHDIVRTRISVVADPQMYRVVEYCRKLFDSGVWPDALNRALERLITDVCEALVLLGRQGQCDQVLLGQLDILCKHTERARVLARELALRHPELPETVRDWLERGKLRVVRHASESAIEATSSNADESIGFALQAARRTRWLRESLQDQLISNLQIYEPNLAATTQELLGVIQDLVIQVEQAASLRSLDLYGKPGEEVEVSPKFFTVVGSSPQQRMTVRKPAIVRKRSDGALGDVITKGLVE